MLALKNIKLHLHTYISHVHAKYNNKGCMNEPASYNVFHDFLKIYYINKNNK